MSTVDLDALFASQANVKSITAHVGDTHRGVNIIWKATKVVGLKLLWETRADEAGKSEDGEDIETATIFVG